jgi:hypothetical protein
MPKRIRQQPIYIAPRILGFYNEADQAVAKDEDTDTLLNPNHLNDKIKIYERQVKGWFLDRASALITTPDSNFIVLMICLSYLEGVEQYRTGLNSNGQSRPIFRNSINRIFPAHNYTAHNLDELYREARCGLFHNGMVNGKIILSNDPIDAITFQDRDNILVNPRLFLNAIINDFDSYILVLQNDQVLRSNFNQMFSVL